MPKPKRKPTAQQLDLTQLLPGFEIDRSDPSRGIQIRAKELPVSPAPPSKYEIRLTAPAPAPPPAGEARYDGIKIVNGKVIREGRHSNSEWQYVGLAGALPRRIWDYHPDVVLERRADEDGIVRLLPVADTAGELLGDLEYV